MKISVSSYSFQQYISLGKMTQFDTVAAASDMGFDGIEFTELQCETQEERINLAERIKKKAEELGIEVVAYAVSANLYNENAEELREEVGRVKKKIDVAKALGAKIVRHDVCYSLSREGCGRSFGMMLPTIASCAREISEYASTLGIKTCTENHGFIAQDSYRIEQLFNTVGHQNFGVLVDIGNFLCVDEEPASAVSRVAPYAVHVHAKDMLVSEEASERTQLMTRGAKYLTFTAIGEGSVPVKRCLEILKRAGYDGYITIEYESRKDAIEGVKNSLAALKGYMSEI